MAYGGKRKGSGRKRGVPNKLTSAVRDVIAGAAEKLGGQKRLVAWAQEDAQNERIFWGSIYPKMLPLDITTGGLPLPSPKIIVQPGGQ